MESVTALPNEREATPDEDIPEGMTKFEKDLGEIAWFVFVFICSLWYATKILMWLTGSN